MMKINTFLEFKPSDVVSIMLIKVKMPTIIFTSKVSDYRCDFGVKGHGHIYIKFLSRAFNVSSSLIFSPRALILGTMIAYGVLITTENSKI